MKTRRSFLRDAGLGGAGLVILANSRSVRTYAANEKVNVAHIGCGGRGTELIGSFCAQTNIVAMCDVNKNRAQKMFEKFPDAPKYEDFRKMLDEKGKEIDAVIIATPDHIHAPASTAAIKAGKHVYTEKPLTRLVQESRALRDLARKHKVATSMGNQGTASGGYRRAIELIQNGTLGQIKTVYSWTDQGGQGWKSPPQGEEKIPPYLNWDLWLGPAKSRPFNIKWMGWQFWREFGTAQLGNWASHISNLAFRSMKVESLWVAPASAPAGAPPPAGRDAGTTRPLIKIESKTDAINRLGFPKWEHVQWHIPQRGDLPPITFNWINGGGASPQRAKLEEDLGRELDWGDKGEKKWKDWAGSLIVGTQGKLYTNGHNTVFTLLPEDKFKGVQREKPEKLESSQGHERDWLLACKGGQPAWANFDFAGPLTEFNMLGNVSTQFEGTLEYDPLECKILNNDEADKALRYEYREGWSL
ncbi:MAG TPA: Gfo/Idh/MocA family oxidoreductase [Planctomycetota bacterium]|jgi:hypothetical protein